MSLDLREIEVGLYKAVSDLNLVAAGRVAYENNNVSDELFPRVEVDIVVRNHPVLNAKGSIETENGRVAVTIITRKDNGTADAAAITQQLWDAFYPGATIDLPTSGALQFTRFPRIDDAYEDYSSWRQPVMLYYHVAVL